MSYKYPENYTSINPRLCVYIGLLRVRSRSRVCNIEIESPTRAVGSLKASSSENTRAASV